MYILVIVFRNEAVEHIGPFPTLFRANEYLEAVLEAPGADRIKGHAVMPLIIPFSVVQKVEWR